MTRIEERAAAPDAAAVRIVALAPADWPDVAAIYADGIATRQATFETAVPSWAEWDAVHLREHRLVARAGDRVAGWVALSPTSSRPAYAGVAELSVYVAHGLRGRGIGSRLLRALVDETDTDGIWTLEAGIFPENLASVRLHLAHGFRVVGVRERIGRLDGSWRDVVLLERRRKEVDR